MREEPRLDFGKAQRTGEDGSVKPAAAIIRLCPEWRPFGLQ